MVKQKIASLTEMVIAMPDEGKPLCLMFLPDNELHEIALLFLNYRLKSLGFSTRYFGSAMPISSLEKLVKNINPGIIITNVYNNRQSVDVKKMLAILKSFRSKEIYLSGPAFFDVTKPFAKNIFTYKDYKAVLNSIVERHG